MVITKTALSRLFFIAVLAVLNEKAVAVPAKDKTLIHSAGSLTEAPRSSFSGGAILKIDLSPDNFRHIKFDSVRPTDYSFRAGNLEIAVRESASFLIKALPKPVRVQRARIFWRADRLPQITKQGEKTKSGDDAALRVGLFLLGKPEALPFFIPEWMKEAAAELHQSAEKVLFLKVACKSPAGTRWLSPVSDKMETLCLASTRDGQWIRSEGTFATTEVVGIWLMADGDNTKSSFKVWVKSVEFD